MVVISKQDAGALSNGMTISHKIRAHNELPRSKLRGIRKAQPQNPKTSEQLSLDILAMQLLIRLFLPLLLDIVANDFFIAVTANSAHKVAFGPKFSPPTITF
jgi:hypothetical protein